MSELYVIPAKSDHARQIAGLCLRERFYESDEVDDYPEVLDATTRAISNRIDLATQSAGHRVLLVAANRGSIDGFCEASKGRTTVITEVDAKLGRIGDAAIRSLVAFTYLFAQTQSVKLAPEDCVITANRNPQITKITEQTIQELADSDDPYPSIELVARYLNASGVSKKQILEIPRAESSTAIGLWNAGRKTLRGAR